MYLLSNAGIRRGRRPSPGCGSYTPGVAGCILRCHGAAISVIDVRTIIHSDPEILGGTPVFVGTRVPAQSLFDYLEGGETLDEFLRQFPSVRRDQAIAALDLARATLLAGARSS